LGLVEVEMVEIGMWVGSRDEDACDEKADSCDRAAEFWKAGASGINRRHVESPSWFSSRKLAIGLIGSFLSSKGPKLEMTGFQSAKAACASLSFSPEFGVNV
jgi:hypothetical protein